MEKRTIFLSKLVGLYCLILGVAYILQKDAVLKVATALFRDAPLTLVLGIFVLILGLATIVGHNVWRGGLAPVLVTLLGWIATLKGVSFLVLSPAANTKILEIAHFEQLFYVYMGVTIAIGAYLTYSGFRPKRT